MVERIWGPREDWAVSRPHRGGRGERSVLAAAGPSQMPGVLLTRLWRPESRLGVCSRAPGGCWKPAPRGRVQTSQRPLRAPHQETGDPDHCLPKRLTPQGWDTQSTLACPHLVQHWLVQLLNTQVADPGQELPGLNEQAGAQQEGEDVGFLGANETKVAHAQEGMGVGMCSQTALPPGPRPSPGPAVSPMPRAEPPTGWSPTSG